MPIRSANSPWRTGSMAPPTIAAHKIPEPCPVCFPKPFTASEKIVGNMMELNRPTERIVHMTKEPLPIIVIKTKTAAVTALNVSTLLG